MNMNEPPSLLRNDLRVDQSLAEVEAGRDEIEPQRHRRVGIVTAGGRRQRQDVLSQSSFYSQNDLRLHFGLGRRTRPTSVEIRWPLGLRETYRNVKANRI